MKNLIKCQSNLHYGRRCQHLCTRIVITLTLLSSDQVRSTQRQRLLNCSLPQYYIHYYYYYYVY